MEHSASRVVEGSVYAPTFDAVSGGCFDEPACYTWDTYSLLSPSPDHEYRDEEGHDQGDEDGLDGGEGEHYFTIFRFLATLLGWQRCYH